MGGRAARPALSLEENSQLARLRWVIALHWVLGALILLRTAVPVLLSGAGAPLRFAFALIVGVLSVNAVVHRNIRRWPDTRRAPIASLAHGVLTLMALLDMTVVATVVHATGGSDSLILPIMCLPPMVFGNFLARRTTYLLVAWGTLLLAGVLVAEQQGLLAHTCPPLPGLPCTIGSVPVMSGRLATTVVLIFLAGYLASFIAASLERQGTEARRVAEERRSLATARSRFVATASHELRTPLATLLSASESLSRYWDRMTPAQRQERIDKLAHTIEHMFGLLEDVVTIGQIGSGGRDCRPQRVDLAALCRAVADEVQRTSTRTGALLVEAAGAPPAVQLDPVLMRQVVRHLLRNAVNFSPADRAVVCRLRRDADHVRLSVHDHGSGIPPGEQPRLFEPFHRGANAIGVPGAGLGLLVTRTAVHLLGGAITIDSAAGAGTTVTVDLPLPPDAEVVGS